MRNFSRPLSMLLVIAWDFDWLTAQVVHVVIGRSNYFDIAFRQSCEKRSSFSSSLLHFIDRVPSMG